MSKKINVNPDHYKVAGRERQGENVVHNVEKRRMKQLRRDEKSLPGQPQRQKAAAPRRASPVEKGKSPANRRSTKRKASR